MSTGAGVDAPARVVAAQQTQPLLVVFVGLFGREMLARHVAGLQEREGRARQAARVLEVPAEHGSRMLNAISMLTDMWAVAD